MQKKAIIKKEAFIKKKAILKKEETTKGDNHLPASLSGNKDSSIEEDIFVQSPMGKDNHLVSNVNPQRLLPPLETRAIASRKREAS